EAGAIAQNRVVFERRPRPKQSPRADAASVAEDDAGHDDRAGTDVGAAGDDGRWVHHRQRLQLRAPHHLPREHTVPSPVVADRYDKRTRAARLRVRRELIIRAEDGIPGDPIAIMGTLIEHTDDVHSTDLFDDVD